VLLPVAVEAFRARDCSWHTHSCGPSDACSAPKSLAGRVERRCHNKKHRRHRLEKSPVPRKGPRCTPPGPDGAFISENARPSGNSYLHGRRRVSGSRRQTKPLGSLVISLRHCQTSVMAIPGKSPVPRKGPRSAPPGPVGAWIRKMRVQAARTFTDISGSRGSRRQTRPFAARGRASREGPRVRIHLPPAESQAKSLVRQRLRGGDDASRRPDCSSGD